MSQVHWRHQTAQHHLLRCRRRFAVCATQRVERRRQNTSTIQISSRKTTDERDPILVVMAVSWPVRRAKNTPPRGREHHRAGGRELPDPLFYCSLICNGKRQQQRRLSEQPIICVPASDQSEMRNWHRYAYEELSKGNNINIH